MSSFLWKLRETANTEWVKIIYSLEWRFTVRVYKVSVQQKFTKQKQPVKMIVNSYSLSATEGSEPSQMPDH